MGIGTLYCTDDHQADGGEITVQSVENEYCQFEFWPSQHEEPKLKAGKKEKDPAKDKKEENDDGYRLERGGRDGRGAACAGIPL